MLFVSKSLVRECLENTDPLRFRRDIFFPGLDQSYHPFRLEICMSLGLEHVPGFRTDFRRGEAVCSLDMKIVETFSASHFHPMATSSIDLHYATVQLISS